jgi:leader peptidase (prepilin peptidase)/N-methyltransferase
MFLLNSLTDLAVLPGSIFAAFCAGIFGLLIGSFLNVVIYRIPKMMQRDSDNYVAEQSSLPLPHTDHFNLSTPRSACPDCGHKITAIENIPVASYLFLRGKCSGCKAPISVRYPLVELATGIISAAVVYHFGSGMIGLASLVFTYFLIALAGIDADTKLLPDDLTLPLLWLGLVVNVSGTFTSLPEAVIGAVAGYLILWTFYWAFKIITGKEGMGYGDFKFLAAISAWFGWQLIPAILVMSTTVGIAIAVLMLALRKNEFNQTMPFGPYLAGAGLIILFYGSALRGNLVI